VPSCHHSAAGFQSGIKQGIVTVAWVFWLHGRKHGLWHPIFLRQLSVDVATYKNRPTVIKIQPIKKLCFEWTIWRTDLHVVQKPTGTTGTPKQSTFKAYEGVEHSGYSWFNNA